MTSDPGRTFPASTPALPSDSADTPVAVLGAGPVGLVAALLLARYGVACQVFERHPAPYPLPRAVHVDDEVMRILQAVGAADTFAAHSRPSLGMQLVDSRHRVLARFLRDAPEGAHGFPQANMFDQPELEHILRDLLKQEPLVSLHGDTEILGLTLAPPGSGLPTSVRVRDITTGAERTVLAAAVLGCDGATSLTRQAIGSRHLLLGRPQHWLVVDVRCPVPLPAWEGVHQVCDPARPATYMRIGEDRYRWEFRLTEPDAEEAMTDRARILRLLSPWTGSIPEEHLEVVRLARYTFRAQVADSWRQDRVFLLGDAAHLTPPFIGQGLGAGLRDAHNLTWKLARVLKGQSSESLLDTYESERRPHAIHLVRTAVRIGHAMTSAHPVARVSRRVGLAVGRHTELLTQAALATLSPALRGGVLTGGGHNLARLPGRGPRPGELGPQPPMRTLDNLPVRLDDLLGDGFALLTCRTPTPTERRLAQALAARIVTVLPPGGGPVGVQAADETFAIDTTGALSSWLRDGTALLRPDRVVLAAHHGADDSLAESAHAWAKTLAPAEPRAVHDEGTNGAPGPPHPRNGRLIRLHPAPTRPQ
ncbi:bifunctional 3-(3-hydroxy-phenyl)propionate/3-hydroxycinnamic acid hydroxylase [Streptomyces sp. NPDC087856]|uniref:bifunctional 3-(3-hydroxy-phenyl)propionate/3-hydroxycinnamic acid hydroxylase MhpA n=1 Tax=Streptomyces sp. NPDC087856 TaxID=3365811 RepID=UPI00381E7540